MAKSLLQESFLGALCKQRALVAIYLTNGIKLQGRLEAFDATSLKLTHTVTQIVYKHAISTISELNHATEVVSK